MLGYLTTDIIGTSRSQGVAWDIGAYQFVQEAPSLAIHPSAESALAADVSAPQPPAADTPSAATDSAAPVNSPAAINATPTAADTSAFAATNIASTPVDASSATSTVPPAAPSPEPGYLVNLSARANVGTGNNILIGGFTVSGSGSEQLLLRGIGPALFDLFGLSGNLTAPQLTLTDSSGLVIAGNTGWSANPTLGPSPIAEAPEAASSSAMSAVGAFACNPGSADTALVVRAPVGSSTLQVSGIANKQGIALVEIYDAGTGSGTARLVNISARANVGTGNNILIGGFTIGGSTTETVLIRAVGPGLTDTANLTDTLAHPVLTLFSAGTQIGSNTGWGGNAAIAVGLRLRRRLPTQSHAPGLGDARHSAPGQLYRPGQRRQWRSRPRPHGDLRSAVSR